jgi:hypothetical protein
MNRSSKRLGISLGVAVVLVLGVPGLTVASADNRNPTVFPSTSSPYGQTYGQWSARWWQYAAQQTTLNICAPRKPQSPVTFLAGTPGPPPAATSCTVPSGQAIMFPLLNAEWSVAEAQAQELMTPGQSCFLPGQPDGTTNAVLRACAKAIADHAISPDATMAAEVDGASLRGLSSYRAVSPPFSLTAADGNPFGIPPGRTHAVADGFWIILKPLSQGTHTIHFSVNVPFPELGFTFSFDQTYYVTVQRRNED